MKKFIITGMSIMLFSMCTKEQNPQPSSPGNAKEVDLKSLRSCMAMMHKNDKPHSRGSYLVGETDHFWPNNPNGPTIIRVKILQGSNNSATSIIQSKIKQYAKVWEKYANIRFDFVPVNQPAEIRIGSVQGQGSWSYVGTVCRSVDQNEPTMNYGWFNDWTDESEFSRVIVHEFGHAIGFGHEQSHPEISLQWNKPVVYAYYAATNGWSKQEVDNNVLYKYPASETTYSAYDPTSIMHYPVPENFTLNGVGVGWNTELSHMDKSFIGKIYPFPSTSNKESILYTIIGAPTTLYGYTVISKLEIKINNKEEICIHRSPPDLPLNKNVSDKYVISDISGGTYTFTSKTILPVVIKTNLKSSQIKIFKNGTLVYDYSAHKPLPLSI